MFNTAAVVFCCLQASRVAPASSRKLAVSVRAGADYDRDTGFVAEDNSGRANIFPRKQQAYIKSSTSDAAARQGLGGLQGEQCCKFIFSFLVCGVNTVTAPSR